MISRLSALAALFAVVTTTSLAYAANVAQQRAASVASAPTEVIAFPAVQVIGKRSSFDSN